VKPLSSPILAAIAAAALMACTSDAPTSTATRLPAAPASRMTATGTSEGADRVERTQAIQVTANVLKIDPATRHVTLQLPAGREVELVAAPSVKNLSQVSVGDQVRVTYYESLVFQLRPPGQAAPATSAEAAVATAPPGAMPAGVALGTVTVTTTVKDIDRDAQTITLATEDGGLRTLPVQDPANLDKVKVGDRLDITYSEALAVDVQKP
jgi:Cu/Ag efflux protein CusF